MWIVVGLGNPGKKYERTRHNVGQDAVTEIARRHDATLKEGRDKSLVAEVTIREEKVLLAVPLTFMNESGQAVRGIVKRHNMKPDQFGTRLVIVHDELDLPPGTVRVKEGGGLAGHNGLRSITSHLSTQDYLRVRIGVGKPPSAEMGADHVLRKVPPAERQLLDDAESRAADAVESLIVNGVAVTMNTFNQ
ncbi:MAG: aminoacyl-tRNA hydrolase [Actinobacteria bacterium]|nr:aminoacyl-tRNA hydrolase [Actinomycetota bacterium]NBP53281.1 aminoacyl-tRNA hydrolase [Actinomycetota bacterium]